QHRWIAGQQDLRAQNTNSSAFFAVVKGGRLVLNSARELTVSPVLTKTLATAVGPRRIRATSRPPSRKSLNSPCGTSSTAPSRTITSNPLAWGSTSSKLLTTISALLTPAADRALRA